MSRQASIAEAEWLQSRTLQTLLSVLNEGGEEARIAGGAVRNALLGEAVADIDIATTTVPGETARRAEAAGFRVTTEMLVHAGADDAALAGLDLPGLLVALRPFHDRLVGPTGIRRPICDNLPARQRLSRMANLADLAAHRLLAAEIRARGLDARQPALEAAPC